MSQYAAKVQNISSLCIVIWWMTQKSVPWTCAKHTVSHKMIQCTCMVQFLAKRGRQKDRPSNGAEYRVISNCQLKYTVSYHTNPSLFIL